MNSIRTITNSRILGMTGVVHDVEEDLWLSCTIHEEQTSGHRINHVPHTLKLKICI